jgi:hypothetical protein
VTAIIHDCETGEITEVEDKTDYSAIRTEMAWSALRSERNRLLATSDWTVLGDSPTPTAAWKAYRQALRDLPANTADPLNVVWPTPPS